MSSSMWDLSDGIIDSCCVGTRELLMINSKILKIVMENTKFNEKTKYIKLALSFLDSFKVLLAIIDWLWWQSGL